MSAPSSCITNCNGTVLPFQRQERENSGFAPFSNSVSSSLSFSGSVNFISFRHICYTASVNPISVKVNFMPTVGGYTLSTHTCWCFMSDSIMCATNNELEALPTEPVGANDLLIVGPGVLGRIIAEKWRKEHPGCQICGQTRTSDHHDELIKMGINPSLKGTQVTTKFPYVIFCAPPYQNPDFPGDVREATLNWSGKGSFLFTSSSAPFDCSDNGSCDEDTPVVPVGRSPKTDNLLKAEKVVFEAGGCVVRLAGLYISF